MIHAPLHSDESFVRFKDALVARLRAEKEKEYRCHVRYVRDIGLRLAREYGADPRLVETACLLHDIGRDHEADGEDHGDAGARIASPLLADSGFTPPERALILSCIKNHCKQPPDDGLRLEEKIVVTADGASKVLFHEAFVLMCKKQTYEERLAWSLKYLEKGYRNILFPAYREEVRPRYEIIRQIYDRVVEQ